MLEDLRQKPEEYRKKFALGVSASVFLVMFFSWAFFKGYLGYSRTEVVQNTENNNEISLASANLAKAPLSNESSNESGRVLDKSSLNQNKGIFSEILAEIKNQFKNLQESLASVLVPFMSNIEVYDKDSNNK